MYCSSGIDRFHQVSWILMNFIYYPTHQANISQFWSAYILGMQINNNSRSLSSLIRAISRLQPNKERRLIYRSAPFCAPSIFHLVVFNVLRTRPKRVFFGNLWRECFLEASPEREESCVKKVLKGAHWSREAHSPLPTLSNNTKVMKTSACGWRLMAHPASKGKLLVSVGTSRIINQTRRTFQSQLKAPDLHIIHMNRPQLTSDGPLPGSCQLWDF